MVLLGLGTALVYPTPRAAVSDVVHSGWRASAVGVYRLWRDSGYAIGALHAGMLADFFGVPWAIGVIGGVTFLSGVVILQAMSETLPRRATSRGGVEWEQLVQLLSLNSIQSETEYVQSRVSSL